MRESLSNGKKGIPVKEKYRAMVSTAHPIATGIGIDVLEHGGNCVDAAVAVAAALNIVDMGNTGIGGDAFALAYFKKEGRVVGLNASGRAPFTATIEEYRKRGISEMPERGPLVITTPGALSGWAMLHERYGTIPFGKLVEPAIQLAKDGFQINPAISIFIALSAQVLSKFPESAKVYLDPFGGVPSPGETLRQQALGESLEIAARNGPSTRYGGVLGRRVAEFVQDSGGLLSERDFAEHHANWVEPIHTTYRDCEVYTIPPNSQGLTLLEMLNIMEGYEIRSMSKDPAAMVHLQVEAKKLAFYDRNNHICDPDFVEIPIARLLSKEYSAAQRGRININRASTVSAEGKGHSGDTTYFSIVDADGNAVSFINSLFDLFGSGIVAGDTGIILQNRGKGFSLDSKHANSLQPHKRPMHTLVPCMVMKNARPFLVIGCVGGDQQTPGLLQILMNIIDLGMSPQEAIDAPRWRSYEDNRLVLETATPANVVHSMSARGHILTDEIDFFGGSQCIMFDDNGYLVGGSDRRLAGCWQGLA